MNEHLSLAASWGDLAPRLVSHLRRVGIDPDVADDVVQETALKLIRVWERIDTDRPIWPLARAIAMNCVADRYRGQSPILLGELPDSASPYDVEEHGLARARLAFASRALEELTPNDRSLLLAEIGIGHRSSDRSATRMARMRARDRLHSAMERLAPAFSGVALKWRRLTTWVHGQSQIDALGANALAGLLVAVTAVVATLSPGQPDSKHDRGQTHPDRVSFTDTRAIAHRMPRLAKKPEIAPAERLAVAKDLPSEDRPPSTADEHVHARTGPTGAYSGEGQGYIYASVCFGQDTEDESDDWGVTVAVFDGNQSGEEEPPKCREDKP